ncbi:hypothetical protein M9458_012194, partial [Cirrhinus mrigala]
MSLSLYSHTQTVALHPGLHYPSATAPTTCAQSETVFKPRSSRHSWPSIELCLHSYEAFLLVFLCLVCLFLSIGTLACLTSLPPRPYGLRLSSRPYTCLLLFDPACLTMSLSRPFNKSMHMDPLVSRLTHTVTEYSASKGSSNFSSGHSPGMDSDRILFRIRQGPQALEQYICEFLAVSDHSSLPDCVLCEIFCDGVNEPLKARLRREGPRSSLAAFMDFALLCVGSSFTVGVAEEERDNAVTAAAHPAQRMAAAPKRDATEPLTAWIAREMAAVAERARAMAATVEPVHKMAATPGSSQVAAAFPESSQVPESSKISATAP